MKKIYINFRPCLFLCLILISGIAIAGEKNDSFKARIMVLPIENKTRDVYYDAFCRSISETISLQIDQSDNHTVPILDYDMGKVSEIKLRKTAEKEKMDDIIFGESSPLEPYGIHFSMKVFNRRSGSIKSIISADIEDSFQIFDIIDEVSARIIPSLSSSHWGFGTIILNSENKNAPVSVKLDGEKLFNHQLQLRRIFNGTHKLQISVKTMTGENTILNESFEILDGEKKTFSYTVPNANKADKDEADKNLELLQQLIKKEDFSRSINIMNKLQTVKLTLAHDKDLSDRIGSALLEAENNLSLNFSEKLDTGDKLYFSKAANPFPEALKVYKELAVSLNTQDSYKVLSENTTDIRNVYAHTKGPIIVEGADKDHFIFKSADNKTISELDLPEGWNTRGGSLYISPNGLIYYRHADKKSLLRFNGKEWHELSFPFLKTGTKSLFTGFENRFFLDITDDTPVFFDINQSRYQPMEQAVNKAMSARNLENISDIHISENGEITLFSGTEGKLLILNSKGKELNYSEIDETTELSGIDRDRLGYYYITNPDKHQYVKITPDGRVIEKNGRFGTGEGDFSRPTDIVFDKKTGELYICDSFNGRLQKRETQKNPSIIPGIAELGIKVASRKNIAENAVKKMDQASFGSRYAINALQWSAGAGAIYGGTTWLSENEWTDTSNLTAGYALLTAGHYMTTKSILNAYDALYAPRKLRDQLQTVNMDYYQEVDLDKYKSLRKARSVSTGWSLCPQLTSSLMMTGSFFLNSETDFFNSNSTNNTYYGIALAMAGYMPSGTGNIYSGYNNKLQMTVDLFCAVLATGMWADIIFNDFGIIEKVGETFITYEDNYYLNEELDLDDERMNPQMVGMFTIGALINGIKLASALHDYQTSWKEAQFYNTYKAVKKTESRYDISWLPVIYPQPGLALTLRY